MSEPECPQKAPYEAELDSEKSYWWCACGRSKNQPYCDGSHKGTDFVPLEVKVRRTRTYWLCGCKKTSTPPYCDGAHNNL